MTHKEWPFFEAQRIRDRLSRIGTRSVTAETGYGPSGLPHIGTFGEVARTSFVLQALAALEPGIDTRIVAFSDDMDGLRDVPKNLPNAQMLQQHLGKPLTSIPDPFGEEKSFAHYMNRKLREFLDSYGFRYEFASSTDQYASGVFDDGLRRIMQNYDAISELFKATIAEEKRAAWSPFFPVCENCGRVYSTRVTSLDRRRAPWTMPAMRPLPGKYQSCGHAGTRSILGGACKVGWKVDWALRWFSLGIDYEMHGEDLLDSARLSSRIVKILGGEPPELFKYELFLDEKGKKISKKIGNGISLEQWLRFAPVDSLLYLMYMKPQQAKKMGLPILPEIVDQYLELVAQDEGAEDSPVPFISRLSRGAHAGRLPGGRIITYSLILELILALNQDDPPDRARLPGEVRTGNRGQRGLLRAAHRGCAGLLPRGAPAGARPWKPRTTSWMPRCLPSVTSFRAAPPQGRRRIPTSCRPWSSRLPRTREIRTKDWFRALYRIFLGQSQGPRIGSFIALLGYATCIERLGAHLARGPNG